jgi:VCBS repeat protein
MQDGGWIPARPQAGYQPSLVGDFNGDGTSDIAWYNPTTNNIEIWLIKDGQWAGNFDIGLHPPGASAVGVGDFDHSGCWPSASRLSPDYFGPPDVKRS